MSIRGVRGATVASQDEPEAILSATRELLEAILRQIRCCRWKSWPASFSLSPVT